MKLIHPLGSLAVLVVSAVSADAAVIYSNYFNTPGDLSGSGLTTDRYTPSSVTHGSVSGDGVMSVTVNSTTDAANRPAPYGSTFYNTQGVGTQVSVVGTWSATAMLYVTEDMFKGTGGVFESSFWVRTSADGTEATADYFIIGLRNSDPSDLYNVNSQGITTGVQTWDSDFGYTQQGAGTIVLGLNTLTFVGDSSGVSSYLNGTLLYHDSDVQAPENFTGLIFQERNFGDGTSHTADWSSVVVTNTVPEPGSTALALVLSGGLICLRGRRR